MLETFSFTYHNLPINGLKIGRGEPLLMLHGWGSSAAMILPLARQLKDTYCCYLIDFPGFGETPEPPESWSVDDYTDLVEYYLQEHFNQPVYLFAHSFGGRVALKLCARESGGKLVRKVLITGGAGMKPKRKLGYYLKKYTAKALKASLLVLPSSSRKSATAKLRKTRIWKALGSSDYAELHGVMRETFVKVVNDFLESCLPHIPHEALLVWGKKDLATPLYQARRMEKGIQNAALVEIENAGHYALLEQPTHFAAIAKAFFEV